MKIKPLMLILFLLMVVAQLYVPASMIWSKEKVLNEGTLYKFLVRPVDPNDPFRGKYIVVNVEANHLEEHLGYKWEKDEEAYVALGTDEKGFAQPLYLSAQKPEGVHFVKVKIDYANNEKVIFKYPFDRFYMDEDKAYAAEQIYFESLRDTNQLTYALVMVNDGNAVLQDVQINGTSIADLVDAQAETSESLKFN